MTTLENSNVGFSNFNFLTVTPISDSFNIFFGDMTRGIYEVVISNFNAGDYYIGYISWVSESFPMTQFGQVATGGVIITIGGLGSFSRATVSGVSAGSKYNISLKYVAEVGVN